MSGNSSGTISFTAVCIFSEEAVKGIPKVQLQYEMIWLQVVEVNYGGMNCCLGSLWDAINQLVRSYKLPQAFMMLFQHK